MSESPTWIDIRMRNRCVMLSKLIGASVPSWALLVPGLVLELWPQQWEETKGVPRAGMYALPVSRPAVYLAVPSEFDSRGHT